MPSRKRERNICSRKTSYISNMYRNERNRGWGFNNNTTSGEQKDMDEPIYSDKATVNKERESWKVVPKDSCEVYRDRRKRQIDADRKKKDKKYDENNQNKRKDPGKVRKIRRQRRITRKRKIYNPRRRHMEPSSSYTTLSSNTSCSC